MYGQIGGGGQLGVAPKPVAGGGAGNAEITGSGRDLRAATLRKVAGAVGETPPRSSITMFFAAIFLHGLCLANAVNFTTVYQWDELDFIWPSGTDSSIGQMKDEYKPGNKKYNCGSIQRARGMETDPDGRLWILDNGSRNCASKVWIFNLLKNDTIERVHHFPDTVVSHSYGKRNLYDVVVDKTTDDYLAYITDFFSEHVVVYSKMDKSWEARQLYLRRFDSKELYSVSVSELKNEGGNAAVKLIGEWTGTPYRMLIDSANVLYAAISFQNYLSKWNISEPFLEQRFHEANLIK
ncbi:uncharacterized protein LOC135936072 [Cloeon dipterum]|uniref:uncharacterized protein LOC135936072 n=1 Tax=Cloeon dipterum TaxID=197152 RepID=UPI00321FC013